MIIGIAGPAGCGKDTAADFLVQRGFLKLSFADPIKHMIKYGMGLGAYIEESETNRHLKEQPIPSIGKSLRQMYQTLGTEWGRDMINPDLWVLLMQKRIASRDLHKIVIPDVRMENEAAFVRDRGKLVHLWRETAGVFVHPTEAGVICRDDDIKIDNSGSLEELQNAIEAAAR